MVSPVPSSMLADVDDSSIFIVSKDQFIAIFVSLQEEAGRITSQNASDTWTQYKQDPRFAASYFSNLQDLIATGKIARDFNWSLGKIYFKNYKGKTHVVIKGRPGLRRMLTGTKYLASNPKIVSMRIGYKGVRAGLREGGVLTIVLLTVYDVLDAFFDDQATLGDFVGQLSSDFVKVAIASGVTLASIAALTGVGLASFAAGPVFAAVVIGVGVAFALDWIDDHYRLTERLKAMLNGALNAVGTVLEQSLTTVIDATLEAITALVEWLLGIGITAAEHYFWRKISDVSWYTMARL